MSGELRFRGGVSASFYCSFVTENQQWANVGGTNGFVHVPDFVLPFFGEESRFEVTRSSFEIRGCDFDMQRRSRTVAVAEYSNSHPTSQETRLFRAFSDLVLAKKVDPRWGEIALETQVLVDACRRSAREGREIELD
jgi:predicted dehydrogenase